MSENNFIEQDHSLNIYDTTGKREFRIAIMENIISFQDRYIVRNERFAFILLSSSAFSEKNLGLIRIRIKSKTLISTLTYPKS